MIPEITSIRIAVLLCTSDKKNLANVLKSKFSTTENLIFLVRSSLKIGILNIGCKHVNVIYSSVGKSDTKNVPVDNYSIFGSIRVSRSVAF